MYLTHDKVTFEKSGEVKYTAKDNFFLQFQANLNEYKDNNNFLRINTVTAKNERIKIWKNSNITQFMDYTQMISWVGTASSDTYNITNLDGSV